MTKLKSVLKSVPQTTISGASMLAALESRLAELRVRRDAITAQILVVEQAPNREDSSAFAQAEALLAGTKFEAPTEGNVSLLRRLLAERAAIDQALRIGGSRQTEMLMQKAGDVYAEHFDEISKIERDRVITALRLQKINRDREALRQRLHDAGCPAGLHALPTDSVPLLETGDIEGEVQWALARLVADGIVAHGELNV